MRLSLLSIFILVIMAVTWSSCKEPIEPLYQTKVVQLDSLTTPQLAANIKQEVSLDVAEGLEVSLWASDTLLKDPVAISIDEQGRIFLTQGTRITNSEFDIRAHRDWMTASISFQSVEDRRAFLKATFSEQNEQGERFLKDLNQDGTLDWRDLTVEKEQVWFVEDTDQDGFADRSQLYLEDFNEEITDLANGIEVHNGEVFIAVGPDLWRSKDRDQDGVADWIESISHGYTVHIAFGSHGMSGAKIGPDGRIWWGVGDIGMNVVDQDGKNWKYPNQGVIVRSELDGSGFEVYASGLRNTHEFTFDKYGNLISIDNDGDHRGERERLVYLINGSETGWRINWQFGKYTDSLNNGYKVWMDEGLHIPHWEGQAAYILPPIQNYVNGPTGLVYNPGTALGPQWYDHFFVAEFRGTPARSPIHAFTLKEQGASYVLDSSKEVVKGVLPTGIDFGPEGAMYFGDWIDGWNSKREGRIWKVDVSEGRDSELRKATKELIQTDFSKLSEADLQPHLSHQDMRIRRKAQFELADRGNKGFEAFQTTLESTNQLARIHSIWGIGQLARKGQTGRAQALLPLLADGDPEIVTQAAKLIGDVRFADAAQDLIPLLKHNSLRVRLHACEALGRIAYSPAVDSIIQMVLENNNQDLWLRHAAMVALGRIGDAQAMAALKNHDSKAVRVVAAVALRRMGSELLREYLVDSDSLIAAEAARGIHDDFSIEGALPDLAMILNETPHHSEVMLRRSISANLRVGEAENVDQLTTFINNPQAPEAMRAEALLALSTWGNPSVLDRVDGRYRGPAPKDDSAVQSALSADINNLLALNQPQVVVAAAQAAGRLQLKSSSDVLLSLLKNNTQPEVRRAALQGLFDLGYEDLNGALQTAFNDGDTDVRSLALTLLPQSDIQDDQAVQLFSTILAKGAYQEQQAALSALATIKTSASVDLVNTYLNRAARKQVKPEIHLDIIEAAEALDDEQLTAGLNAYRSSIEGVPESLVDYYPTLFGGDGRRGASLFYEHEAAQCVRCHTVFEMGGTAGPGLAGVAERLQPIELLQALVEPSAQFAAGYEIVRLQLQDEQAISGVVLEESEDLLKIKIGQEVQEIEKSTIKSRTSVPSSMPPMGSILTKKEIRDLVAFLKGLHTES